MIRKVSIEELNKAISKWNSDMLEEGVKMYAEDKEMWITLDNSSGECWIEERGLKH